MHPYVPFAILPVTAIAAWFAASQWSGSETARFSVPSVKQIENPSVPAHVRHSNQGTSDIRVTAFLPNVAPRPPAATPPLILHSVMIGEVNLATINGRVVKAGDSIEGYRVKRIAADGVELTAGDESRRLPMRPLHELPPPVQPGTDPVIRKGVIRHDQNDLNREFWATFDSP